MLTNKKIKAFVPTVNQEKAKNFYMNILGLQLLSQNNYLLEFNANGTPLWVITVETLQPHPFTVLGWNVDNIASDIKLLVIKGVVFERYESFEQDELGIWISPSGNKIAWFKDPDGNLLSLTEN